MRLLDLFCGAGGASVGYHRAGFNVVGVDIRPQPHYPFDFVQSDALEYLANHGHEFDVIHASPPCQRYSKLRYVTGRQYPDMISDVRQLLESIGKPYIIENVPGAPLLNPLMLCGTMFGLRVIRHRMFETMPVIWFAPRQCAHIGKASGNNSASKPRKRPTLENYRYITVTGNSYIAADGRTAMGIDWMTMRELSQAIPPAYTHYIGRMMIIELERKHGNLSLSSNKRIIG